VGKRKEKSQKAKTAPQKLKKKKLNLVRVQGQQEPRNSKPQRGVERGEKKKTNKNERGQLNVGLEKI